MSIAEARRVLQIQDRLWHEIPEVERVFGKAGQADTPTDPAPLSMFETVVTLKTARAMAPRHDVGEDHAPKPTPTSSRTPGMTRIFSGCCPSKPGPRCSPAVFRSILGIKVFGPSLQAIDQVGSQTEQALNALPGTRGVFAERTTGAFFLDFSIRREVAARYGLTVGEVNDVIETAIGGKTVTTTVEGRERYPVVVRYARDFRQNSEALKRVLVPTPTGAQVPLGMLADLSFRIGPPSIRDENGQLVGFVSLDLTTNDIDGYVRAANARIAKAVTFPPGTYLQWAGQYPYLQSAKRRLAEVIPFTLLIIFVLLYLSTRSLARTAIVLLAVPFSLIGAFWLLYLLGYNLSVAVGVGLIALAGLDAETGVIMLLYLDQAWDKFAAAGCLRTPEDLRDAVIEGAVQRIRPKVMTVCAILFGLLPIMWSPATQTGTDVMKRIAAPMIGGVITSALLELLLYPVIYFLWRRRHLPAPPGRPRP